MGRGTAHVGKQAHVNGGHSWLVNPGSVAGIDAPGVEAVPTWILGDLQHMNFETYWEKSPPDVLVIEEGDSNYARKLRFCQNYKVKLVCIPRQIVDDVSTTSILADIKGVKEVPLRVDFGGGWLDVPKYSVKGGYIVNCTITPKVSLENWPYYKNSGLGGSAAFRLLQAKDSTQMELDLGVGWQDPAVIMETGLCVWRSGPKPVLDFKTNPGWLKGRMLIFWMDHDRKNFDHINNKRDYKLIKRAGVQAALSVREQDLKGLCLAVDLSYKAQLKEGMMELSEIKGSLAKKYLGGGHGGYALYLFPNEKKRDLALKNVPGTVKIEPFINTY